MNKSLKIFSYVLAILVVLYIVLKYTGICSPYTMSTSGSEPNVKTGDFILTSNLITPKRGDFIVYEINHSELGESSFIHRLCGMENDTIQITNGTLFVNGKNIDEQYNLQHSYLLNETQFKALNDETIEHFLITTPEGSTGYLTFVDDVDARRYKLAKDRYRTLKTITDPQIVETYQQPWNKDHFGPLIIPKGKIFVIGDNRDNSQDSRHFGCIDASAVKGVRWKTLFTFDTK